MTTGTLGYIFSGAKVLLARPANKDRWNGIGGLVSIGDSANNVLKHGFEAVGVHINASEPLGEVLYHHSVHGNWKVIVYRLDEYSGQPTSSPTNEIDWFSVDRMPFKQMWPGDNLWIPYVIENQKFQAEIWFDANDHITHKDVQDLR